MAAVLPALEVIDDVGQAGAGFGDVRGIDLADIAQAIVTTMEQDSAGYLAQLGTGGALIQVIDQPSPPAP